MEPSTIAADEARRLARHVYFLLHRASLGLLRLFVERRSEI